MAIKYSEFTLGQIEAVFNKIGGEEEVRRFLAGDRKVVITNHVINLDLKPFFDDEFFSLGDHYTHLTHRSIPTLFTWDPARIELLSCVNRGETVKQYLHTLGGRRLNARVRDYLKAHPELIPDAWKVFMLAFCGTTFSGRGEIYVPTLLYKNNHWQDVYMPITEECDEDFVSVMLKK